MTLEELDIALEELEVRLERLRALYEQYFLGFEKVEPSVARKDVDRRIYVLRREKIRNTGKRFKLQTLIQRYNTFQQYWMRICREIENGTYRRHLQRAERTMGSEQILTIAAKRRFGRATIERAAGAQAAAASGEAEMSDAAGSEEEITQVGLGPPPGEEPPPRVKRSSMRPPARSSVRPPPVAHTRSGRPGNKFESLELDMEFLGGWDPLVVRERPAPRAKPASSPKAAPRPPSSPRAAPRLPSSPRAAPPPKPARPPQKPNRARPSAPPKAAPGPVAASGGLSDDRIRELHGRLSDLKRQNREAGRVSMENLAKTLRATEERLRSQHRNRKIDFEVVIRDGKAVVKPTVR